MSGIETSIGQFLEEDLQHPVSQLGQIDNKNIATNIRILQYVQIKKSSDLAALTANQKCELTDIVNSLARTFLLGMSSIFANASNFMMVSMYLAASVLVHISPHNRITFFLCTAPATATFLTF